MVATSNPIQEDTSAKLVTGAAVASTRNASFSRLIFARSVIGRMDEPTRSEFA